MSEEKRSSKGVKDLEELISSMTEEQLAKLPLEEANKIRKEMNPHGRIIEGSDKYWVIAITNQLQNFQEKFAMEAVKAFLFRRVSEWNVPTGVEPVDLFEYVKNPEKFRRTREELEKMSPHQRAREMFNIDWMQKRLIAFHFLMDQFQFNPDDHVRSSYNPSIETIGKIQTPAADIAIKHKCRKKKAFATEYKLYLERKKMKDELDLLEKAEKFSAPEPVAEKKRAKGKARKAKKEEDPKLSSLVREVIPPQDMFHYFSMYRNANYEPLVAAVHDLYGITPAVEFAVLPCEVFDSQDKAKDYVIKHQKELICDLRIIRSGMWNMLETYQKNKDNQRFLDKNSQFLQNILEKQEEDARIGQELIKKKTARERKENEDWEGKKAESFKKWRKEQGGKDESDDDEGEDIEVNVVRIGNGGREFQKSKFYTKAVPPEAKSAVAPVAPVSAPAATPMPVSGPAVAPAAEPLFSIASLAAKAAEFD